MKASQLAKASNRQHINRVVIRQSVTLHLKKQAPHDASSNPVESRAIEGYLAVVAEKESAGAEPGRDLCA
jgi:hypothetical protein